MGYPSDTTTTTHTCASGSGSGSSSDSCTLAPPPTTLGTLVSLSPFIATFAIVSLVVARRVFPRLSRAQAGASANNNDDDEDEHVLPASAPASLRQAHAEHAARSLHHRRRAAAWTFAATLGLTALLAELILADISDLVSPHARAVALRFTLPTLLFLLIVVIPLLELRSVVAGSGWSFRRKGGGRSPRVAWGLLFVLFSGWLFVFWSVGGVITAETDGARWPGTGSSEAGWFDSTGMTIGRAAAGQRHRDSLVELLRSGRLARACLERIGVIGILLMALLSGFASVSSPWHAFADQRAFRRRPVTEADVARKQAGLEATREMLASKRHRLRALQRRVEETAGSNGGGGGGLVGKMLGSLKGMASSEASEIKGLALEIKGLEAMEANLAGSLAVLRTRQAEHRRDGTVMGMALAVPRYGFSVYCVYRILATTLTTVRRAYYPGASFSSSDPINRFLGLLAKHWDPKLDQLAWARQISFLLSGVILAASANSALQTFHLFAKWAPGLLYQAQANLALLVGQIAATYVISSALLLRSNLPREVGRSVGDALESALEPGFVDRWFEGWFLVASAVTLVGIWVGRKLAGGGLAGDDEFWDDGFGMEELGQKRS
ncbi:Abscisic acid G-protein coupled receptor-domain-containing protein [Cercophora scortea]|uniref:Abscisic acid G-protein coupled receptor-domain-containing protein n=1 Tax=Cercophora scortea TaxID=314031 RepID=A0AAE0IXW5_9PEZI|nr:Abscisic acid G-protein coupled receptor-domain-containing protein [Cercophora scortea]